MHIKDRYLEHFLWNCPHVNATRPQASPNLVEIVLLFSKNYHQIRRQFCTSHHSWAANLSPAWMNKNENYVENYFNKILFMSFFCEKVLLSHLAAVFSPLLNCLPDKLFHDPHSTEIVRHLVLIPSASCGVKQSGFPEVNQLHINPSCL